MDKAQKLHANPAVKPLVQRAPFRIAAAFATLLTVAPLNPFMGGQDRLNGEKKKPGIEENHPAKITASKLEAVKPPKMAVKVPVEGILHRETAWEKIVGLFGPSKAYGADNIIEAKDVLEAISLTEDLKRKGIVQEVKFNSSLIGEGVRIKEWRISRAQGLQDAGNRTTVWNILSKRDQDDPLAAMPFITNGIWDFAKTLGRVDIDLVKGYVIQRPDDPRQSVLVLACKDHLDIYVLNEKKEIEWIPIPLEKVGIEKKPEIIILNPNSTTSKYGKGILLSILDEVSYTKLIKGTGKTGETAKLLVAKIIPHPNDKFNPAEDSKVGNGGILIARLGR